MALTCVRGDHLRVCGADGAVKRLTEPEQGSSPRVRSRPARVQVSGGDRGIISACAEQTTPGSAKVSVTWDHLRVCGADKTATILESRDMGSSPRVRSRRHRVSVAQQHLGIISACAEQTSLVSISRRVSWDHLRVCGADLIDTDNKGVEAGSSPRVRSRPSPLSVAEALAGIISACAEQTSRFLNWLILSRDHLRVCGADSFRLVAPISLYGSSPRVRSRPPAVPRQGLHGGIISACAEQTTSCRWCPTRCRDHLRVCGADLTVDLKTLKAPGSSPRVRSRHRPPD